jgi:hypothetical protein
MRFQVRSESHTLGTFHVICVMPTLQLHSTPTIQPHTTDGLASGREGFQGRRRPPRGRHSTVLARAPPLHLHPHPPGPRHRYPAHRAEQLAVAGRTARGPVSGGQPGLAAGRAEEAPPPTPGPHLPIAAVPAVEVEEQLRLILRRQPAKPGGRRRGAGGRPLRCGAAAQRRRTPAVARRRAPPGSAAAARGVLRSTARYRGGVSQRVRHPQLLAAHPGFPRRTDAPAAAAIFIVSIFVLCIFIVVVRFSDVTVTPNFAPAPHSEAAACQTS